MPVDLAHPLNSMPTALPALDQERAVQRRPWAQPFEDVPAAGQYTGQYIGRVARERVARPMESAAQMPLPFGAHVQGMRTIYAKDGWRFTDLRDTGIPPQHPEAVEYRVPGCVGFVPGLKSENCHGASYASLATEAKLMRQGRVMRSSVSSGGLRAWR
eukprot:7384864-Prymnesium_polylepis.1